MNAKSHKLRPGLILILIFFLGGVVLSRLFYLQINEGAKYKAFAMGQQNNVLDVEGRRGDVYFSNGESLALTERDPLVFVSPEEVEDKEKAAEKLSEILSIDKTEIMEKMNKQGSYYQVIQRSVSKEIAERIKTLNMKGVAIDEKKEKRYYPNNQTASQVIGFLNEDKKGQYGIEEFYNDKLSGKKAATTVDRNPWGFVFKPEDTSSLNGNSLTLTIDYNIQFMAEKYLAEGIEKYGAVGGNIIVMNPNTGEIIAMAQNPSFDPNNYKKEKFEVISNSSTQKIFEPGSIFKPITMSIGVNEKLVTPEDTFEDSGCVPYGKYNVCNYAEKAWGTVTMTEVLRRSINTGVMYVEKKIGHKKFLDYLEEFGFFDKTGIDLANESFSENKTLKKAYNDKVEIAFANASFGQGIGITPLHIITAFSCLTNGGNLMRPYIVREITDNNTKKEVQPQIVRRVISEDTSTNLRKMLVQVVEGGYGHLAKIPGYWIGGKTGTSQVPYASLGINKAGYSDHTWQTFMGFAPAYNPKFIVLVKLDNPTKTKTSEYSAVPIFHDLAKYIFDYWQIPPDYDVEELESGLDKK
ncbi:penicillin-binding protein 2 [bacterium]|nr:penicillin-binding protein 2 [bacterium]